MVYFPLHGKRLLPDVSWDTIYSESGSYSADSKKSALFFVAGADDPVGNNGKSVTQVCQQYKDAGIQDVQIKLYPGDRHEILNETDRDVVYADILTWLNGHLARR